MKLKLYKPKIHLALTSFILGLLLLPGSFLTAQDNPDSTAQTADEPVDKKNKAGKKYFSKCLDHR